MNASWRDSLVPISVIAALTGTDDSKLQLARMNPSIAWKRDS